MPEHDLQTFFTLLELKNRMVNNNLIQEADIAKTLYVPESFTADLLITESNDGDEYVTFEELYEPAGAEVDYNQGAPVTQAQVKPKTWHSCMIEDYYEQEVKLANRSGNWRKSLDLEEIRHVNGLRKRWAQRLFHGTGAGRQITGLAKMPGYTVLGGAQVFDNADGNTPSVTSNKTRIWFIKHSPYGFFTFYPKGYSGNGGIFRDYLGIQSYKYTDAEDNVEKVKEVHRGKIGLGFGSVIKNPAAVVCVVNISTTALSSGTDYDIDSKIINKAINYIDAFSSEVPGKLICYMHSTTRAQLWNVAQDLTLTREYDKALESRIYNVNGIPIHCENQISVSETRLT